MKKSSFRSKRACASPIPENRAAESLEVYPEYKIRRGSIIMALVRLHLHAATEFYEHTALSFKKSLRDIEREYDKYSKAELNRDLGGTTTAELISDQYQETVDLSEMNGYFGVLAVYAVFVDHCLFWLFRDMKSQGIISGKTADKQWLSLDGYKHLFNKAGIFLSRYSNWNDLKKLQALRNVIAHHNGHVLEEDEKKLKPYGCKVGNPVVITEEYFRSAVRLVEETCSRIVKDYEAVIEKRSAKTPGTLGQQAVRMLVCAGFVIGLGVMTIKIRPGKSQP
jgi:hypothetical protein